jgi:hypothetical protein
MTAPRNRLFLNSVALLSVIGCLVSAIPGFADDAITLAPNLSVQSPSLRAPAAPAIVVTDTTQNGATGVAPLPAANVHYARPITATPLFPVIVPDNSATAACGSGGVSLCGTTVPVPGLLPLGATASLSMPSPYEHQPFSVICLQQGGIFSYQIIDQSQVTCALRSCPVQSVTLCGNRVEVPGGTKIGDRITVDVPASVLSDPTYGAASFQAVCNDADNTEPVYKIDDVSIPSCNGFTCPDADIRLCGTTVPVKGGAHMGEVLHQTMPAPFVPDGFNVECLGSGGHPPSYQPVDVTGVTCAKR